MAIVLERNSTGLVFVLFYPLTEDFGATELPFKAGVQLGKTQTHALLKKSFSHGNTAICTFVLKDQSLSSFQSKFATQICLVIQYCNSNKLKMLGTMVVEY